MRIYLSKEMNSPPRARLRRDEDPQQTGQQQKEDTLTWGHFKADLDGMEMKLC